MPDSSLSNAGRVAADAAGNTQACATIATKNSSHAGRGIQPRIDTTIERLYPCSNVPSRAFSLSCGQSRRQVGACAAGTAEGGRMYCMGEQRGPVQLGRIFSCI